MILYDGELIGRELKDHLPHRLPNSAQTTIQNQYQPTSKTYLDVNRESPRLRLPINSMLLFLMRLMLSLPKGTRKGGMKTMEWRMRVIGGSSHPVIAAGLKGLHERSHDNNERTIMISIKC